MLLETKFHTPSAPVESIVRQQLHQQLHMGISQGSRLTLIVAPAGYGKTTLITTYLANYPQPIGWLALDENDNSLSRFLQYFVRCVDLIVEQDLSDLNESLQPTSEPPVEFVIHTLINTLAHLDHTGMLVLEDYHVITNPEIHQAVSLLLEYLPKQIHLTIISRIDPHLQLSKLRVRQQLTEIRVDSLRFNTQESREFLLDNLPFNLTDEQIIQLTERTEGWIGGLYLAALSLQKNPNIDQFIENFTGSHRYIMDYLMDEVLSHQDENIRQFLLKTAILKQMSADICNALLGTTSTQSILEHLEAANIFLIPLDTNRKWYRYHHLFADLLRHCLNQVYPEQVQELHIRAAKWYGDRDYVDDALIHFLAASAYDEACQLVETRALLAIKRGQIHDVHSWIHRLPITVRQASLRLWLDQAWICTYLERHQNLAEIILQARKVAIASASVNFQKELDALEALSRAYNAYNQGDNWLARKISKEMLEQLPESEDFIRSWIALLLIYASYNVGEMKDALTYGQMAFTLCEATKNRMGSLWAIGLLGRVHVLQANRPGAMETYRLALDQGWDYLPYMGTVYQDYGLFLYYVNHIEEAESFLRRGIYLNQQHKLLNEEMEGRLALRQLLWGQGQSDVALTSDEALETIWHQLRQQDVMPEDQVLFLALQARNWLQEGQLSRVREWIVARNISFDTIPDYPLDVEQLILARYQLSQSQDLDLFSAFLPQYCEAVKERGHTLRFIEALILLVRFHLKMSHSRQAKQVLEQLFSIAAPTGFIRLLIDEADDFAHLLLDVRTVAPAFVDEILNKLRAQNLQHISPLVEPLTERELEVLKLMASGLSNRLFLAVGTVKRHSANIFGKLAVKNRTQASARARELKLF